MTSITPDEHAALREAITHLSEQRCSFSSDGEHEWWPWDGKRKVTQRNYRSFTRVQCIHCEDDTANPQIVRRVINEIEEVEAP